MHIVLVSQAQQPRILDVELPQRAVGLRILFILYYLFYLFLISAADSRC